MKLFSATILLFASTILQALAEKSVADVEVSMFQSRSASGSQQARAQVSAFGKQYNLRLKAPGITI